MCYYYYIVDELGNCVTSILCESFAYAQHIDDFIRSHGFQGSTRIIDALTGVLLNA